MQIAISREHIIGIAASKQNVKFRLEALAFCAIIKHDYASASINGKDIKFLRQRMGVGRDRIYRIVSHLVALGMLRKISNGYWQIGKLPKYRGKTKNIYIDSEVCDFSSIDTVVKYLYASILSVKKTQMYFMSSLKHMACGYDITGSHIPKEKEIKEARKKLVKLNVPETSYLSNGFEADLSKHMGQSYRNIACLLGISRSKAIYTAKEMEKLGYIKKEKKSKVVYVGDDAANVLKYKFDGSVYTKFGQSFLFLSRNKKSIIANFSNSYIYSISIRTSNKIAMYA